LRALVRKYRTLAELRARRDAVEATGGIWSAGEGDRRRAAFRRLAEEFPGALRELELPVAVLEARAAAVADELARVEAGRNIGRLWVRVILEFHQLLADVLESKMWLARRVGPHGTIGDEDLGALVRFRGRPIGREEAEELHHPPGGRVVEIVWRALVERHGVSRDTLRELVSAARDVKA
jgi:hypothetical protein